jgi:LEA14-like dessication related protein
MSCGKESLSMQQTLRATVVLFLSVLLAQACSTLKPPTLAVDGLRVGDMGVTGVALDVGFRLRNPNPEPLRIERFEYELLVNGSSLGHGYEPKGVDLAGYGEAKVVSRFDVNALKLPGAVLKVLRQDKVRARAKGRYFTSGSFGHKELGFDSDVDVDLRH